MRARKNNAVYDRNWRCCRWNRATRKQGARAATGFHLLIQRAKLYEEDHGLHGGRQRLRQLIEQGKLYEEEHGLRPRRKRRQAGSEVLVRTYFESLLRVMKPALRASLIRLLRDLQSEDGPEAALMLPSRLGKRPRVAPDDLCRGSWQGPARSQTGED